MWGLIFEPGFSTAEVVTDVSGRGVGMDVVKKNIASLGGSVEIDSAEGYGMSVKVRLPLTLAIMDGMTVRVGDEVYILPLSSVVESFQVQATDINTVAQRAQLVKVRDEYMPVIELDRLLALKQDARTFHTVGKLYLDDGEPAKALEYFRQAMQQPDVQEIARELYYNAGIAEQQLGRLSNARTYFRRALQADPNFGKAYISIGDLYAQAVSECGSQLEREDRAVYWLATDYYERARQVDPSVTNEASQKLNTYRRYFPNQEDLFFKGWKVGQPYRIDYGCYAWINEETTVKPPPSS